MASPFEDPPMSNSVDQLRESFGGACFTRRASQSSFSVRSDQRLQMLRTSSQTYNDAVGRGNALKPTKSASGWQQQGNNLQANRGSSSSTTNNSTAAAGRRRNSMRKSLLDDGDEVPAGYYRATSTDDAHLYKRLTTRSNISSRQLSAPDNPPQPNAAFGRKGAVRRSSTTGALLQQPSLTRQASVSEHTCPRLSSNTYRNSVGSSSRRVRRSSSIINFPAATTNSIAFDDDEMPETRTDTTPPPKPTKTMNRRVSSSMTDDESYVHANISQQFAASNPRIGRRDSVSSTTSSRRGIPREGAVAVVGKTSPTKCTSNSPPCSLKPLLLARRAATPRRRSPAETPIRYIQSAEATPDDLKSQSEGQQHSHDTGNHLMEPVVLPTILFPENSDDDDDYRLRRAKSAGDVLENQESSPPKALPPPRESVTDFSSAGDGLSRRGPPRRSITFAPSTTTINCLAKDDPRQRASMFENIIENVYDLSGNKYDILAQQLAEKERMEAEEREARAIADETNKAFSNLLKLKAAAAAEKEKEAKACGKQSRFAQILSKAVKFARDGGNMHAAVDNSSSPPTSASSASPSAKSAAKSWSDKWKQLSKDEVILERRLEAVYVSFSKFNKWDGAQMITSQSCDGMAASRFLRLCKSAGLLTGNITAGRINYLFNKNLDVKTSSVLMTFAQFVCALAAVAEEKKMNRTQVFDAVLKLNIENRICVHHS